MVYDVLILYHYGIQRISHLVRYRCIYQSLILALNCQVIIQDFLTQVYQLDQKLTVFISSIFNATTVRVVLQVSILLKFENANLKEMIRRVNFVMLFCLMVFCQLVQKCLQFLQRVATTNVSIKCKDETLKNLRF